MTAVQDTPVLHHLLFARFPRHGLAFPLALVAFLVSQGTPFVASAEDGRAKSKTDVPSVKSPLSPLEAQRQFVLESPDLKIELVAAEPDVVAPVAIAFGDDLSLWVVEMRDYPYGPKPGTNEKPKSRIKRLVDQNRDGRYETVTIFADELLFATGLLPWRDGVIVTLAGEIAFFADRDKDGKAEFKETWFTGFAQENSQLRANHPTLGPDGYIYVANGLRGGTVVPAKPEWKAKGQPLPLAGFDFRFNPLTGEYGAVSGHGQFGLCFDDYGNRFVCSNRNPVQHVVLEDRIAKRNPFLAIRQTMHDVAPFAEHSKLYPLSRTWTTSLQHANQFTAACGVLIYRGDAIPPEYRGNAFTCDPTGSLVHREVLVPQGATFTSHPGEQNCEFLATADSWFRPVNLANGPDGTLYVVDMYRAVIEHPDWMPPELKSRKDLYDGSDRGRIWRILPVERSPLQERPDGPLGKLPVKELIELLEHRNSWHRESAARLLLERDSDDVTTLLKHDWKQNRLTRSRLQNLWLLSAIDPRLMPAVLAWSETDNRDPRVREQVIAAIGDNLDEFLADDAINLAKDETDDRVRFRIALNLTGRSADDHQSRKSLIQLLHRSCDDPWLRVAVCTLRADPPDGFLLELLDDWKKLAKPVSGGAELIEEMTGVVAAQLDPPQVTRLLEAVLSFAPASWNESVHDYQAAGLRGIGTGAARKGIAIATVASALSDASKQAYSQLSAHVQQVASKHEEPLPRRLSSVRTLRFCEATVAGPALLALGTGDEEASLRQAALDAVSSLNDPAIGTRLIALFDSQTPPLRRSILDVLLADEGRTLLLVDAMEKGTIKPTEVDVARQPRLTKHRNADIKSRAEKLFAANVSADRAAIVTAYQPALSLKGDEKRGKALFEKSCVTCHRVAGIGTNVGPDIADTYNRTPAYLLTNILDPNRAVDANYFGYTLVTKQGVSYTGLIKSETASSITIRMPEGKEETILRADVDELKSSGQSLMPIGLEKAITAEQMADLIAFLKNWRYLEDGVPLGE